MNAKKAKKLRKTARAISSEGDGMYAEKAVTGQRYDKDGNKILVPAFTRYCKQGYKRIYKDMKKEN
jgi:hypothetical protein